MNTFSTLLLSLTLFVAGVAHAGPIVEESQAKDYRQATRLVEDDPERAWELASRLKPLPYVDAWRLKLLADAALSSGRFAEAKKYALAYADKTDRFSVAFASRLDAVEMMILLGEAEAADKLLGQLERDRAKVKARFTTRRHLRARTLRLRHDLERGASPPDKPNARAKALARQLLLYFPDEVPTKRVGLVQDPKKLSTRDRFIRAKNLYASWAYAEAREEFERLLKEKKYEREALWHIAEVGMNKIRDDFPRAEKLYRKISKEGGKYAPEATYQLARALMRQERYPECIKKLDEYARRFPSGPRIERVYYYKGWLPYDRRQNKRAIKGLKNYIKRYGRKARLTTYVHGFLAWAYMREKQWKNAIDAWEDLLGFGNPVVAGKAYYWMAYAYVQLDKKKAALKQLKRLRKRYPITYYGMLGEQLRAKIEGRDERASKVYWPEGSGTYDATPRFDVHTFPESKIPAGARERWRKVKALVQLGEARAARRTFSSIESSVLGAVPAKDKRAWLYSVGFAIDNYNKMWRVASGATISWVPPAPDPDKLRSVMAYPQAYGDVVREVAKEFELPPYLLWSIMRQESRYKPNAISHTDAVGALQMIPKTARKVAKDLGTEYNPRTFHHPEVGFRFSAFYMKKLLDTFDGLFVPMATAYNSGPDVVARWFKRNPDATFPWLIEEFEYNEGRAYGRKVTEHLLHYVYLYEKDPARRAQLLDKMFPLSRDITIPEDVGY